MFALFTGIAPAICAADRIRQLIVTPERYGAAGDGVTDDTIAIRKAQAALDQSGGGVLDFGADKTYLLSTVSTYAVVVPVAAGNFQPGAENHQYHVLIANQAHIKWRLNGATLKSSIRNGGEMVLLDGVRHFEVENGNIQSVTAKDSSGTVRTVGMNGFGFTSQTRDSYDLKLKKITATNVYAAVYVFGAAASEFRVRDVEIDNLRHEQGIYTLACHDNGDDLSARRVRSIDALREYFIYGVTNHDVNMYSEIGSAGFGAIIKAYDRDTTQIKLKLRTRKDINAANLSLQSQHAPAVQAKPKRLIGLDLDVNNRGVRGKGIGVEFSYWRDMQLASTSSDNLWTEITLRGVQERAPLVNTRQNSSSAGTMNTDDLILLNGQAAIDLQKDRTG